MFIEILAFCQSPFGIMEKNGNTKSEKASQLSISQESIDEGTISESNSEDVVLHLDSALLENVIKESIVKRDESKAPANKFIPSRQVTLRPKYSKELVKSVVESEKNISRLLFLKARLKAKYTKLLQKYEKLKCLELSNYKLTLYANDLEVCIMCLFRNKEFLKQYVDKLLKKIEEEDNDRKKYLRFEIKRIDLLIKQKEHEKDSRLKKLEDIGEKMRIVSENNKKNVILRNSLIYEKDNLNLEIDKLQKDIKMIKDGNKKELEILTNTLTENRNKYELKIADRNSAIRTLEKEKEGLLTREDELLSTISTLNKNVVQTTNEKKVVSRQLEDLIKIKNELQELKKKADKQLEECVEQVVNFYKETITDSKVLKDCHDELAVLKERKELGAQEYHGALQEKNFQNERKITSLLKENEVLRNRKEIQQDTLNSTFSFEKELMNHILLIKNEYESLIVNFYKMVNGSLTPDEGNSKKSENHCCGIMHLQDEIIHGNKKKTELLKVVENLEQTIINQDKEILDFEAQRIQSFEEYTQVLESVKDIARIKNGRESDILDGEEKWKWFTRKNDYLKYTCGRLGEHVATKEVTLQSYEDQTQRKCQENEDLSEKIALLQLALDREQSIGKAHKYQIKAIAEEKNLIDEKLVEMRHVEERKNKQQAKNLELKLRLDHLKSNNEEAHARSGSLLRIIRAQREKLEIQRSQQQRSECNEYSHDDNHQFTESAEDFERRPKSEDCVDW